ncbi:DUF1990 family protein [Knoellia sp. CPCC 206435]|uniref:DUF1990 family protein n=1 Tax=Knoellia terrae TaxID=3404797 RepID=UPI003B43C2BE
MAVHRLDEQRTRELRSAPLTYTPQVAHEDWLRARYHHLTVSTTLTRRDFDGAVRDLFAWCVQSGAGLEVHASDVPLRQGSVVLMTWGPGALSPRIPCRVLDVVHEERRRGFSYGTLPGHPEAGEERFVLEHLEDGRILLTITAYSRLASRLAQLGGPVSRAAQRLMTRRYLQALERLPPEPRQGC